MARHRRMSTQFRIRLFSTTRYGNGIRRVCVLRVCASPLNYTINCHRDNIVSSLEWPSLISVEFYFFPLLHRISFSMMCAIFFPRGHCLLCVQMPQFRNIFFIFFTWETCLDFNMCRPVREIVVCIIGHESRSPSTRRSKSRTDRVHKRKKYIITLVIMAIIGKVYANYYDGSWHCIKL